MFKTLYQHSTPFISEDSADLHLNRVYLNIPNDGKATTITRLYRIIAIVLCLFCIALHLMINPWYNMIVYFSNVTVLTTLTQLSISYYLTTTTLPGNRHSILAVFHSLFEINCGFNLIVVTLYWGLLHEGMMKEFKDQPM